MTDKGLITLILFQLKTVSLSQGNTADAPLGASHLEASDAGLGSTVLDDQPGHEQDSACLVGHAMSAVPCGNQ